VDVSGLDNPVASVNELAEVCEPGTGVIVIGDRNDIVLYRDLSTPASPNISSSRWSEIW
jgi:pilus assembly protein CpaE